PGPIVQPAPTTVPPVTAAVPAPPATGTSDDGAITSTTGSGPVLTSISVPRAFSPNSDGRQDSFPIRATLSAPVAWEVAITDANGSLLHVAGGSGDTIETDWDGTNAGALVPDGAYSYRIL